MTNLRPDKQIDQALAYLASKQCANGSFCGYRMEYLEEPNPRDTFFSVASFQLLGKAVPLQIRSPLAQCHRAASE
jgi:hypothetical protein